MTPRLEKALNLEAKQIAKKLELDDRIECLAKTPAFITFKDHKDNFHSIILQKINVSLVEKLKPNLRKNAVNVLSWLKSIG